jgi:hypothetical protein
MATQKPPWTGLLRQPIYPVDAPARGLRVSLALSPDESDVSTYVEDELKARLAAFDKFFGLDPHSGNIWEQRAKSLVEREYRVRSTNSNWWRNFALAMMVRHVPGISIGTKKKGAPRHWTFELLAQLFADVEFLKKKTGKSASHICKILPKTKGYKERWGGRPRTPGALLKAYKGATKLIDRDFLFALELCGGDVLIPAKGTDVVEAAIERHALKIEC